MGGVLSDGSMRWVIYAGHCRPVARYITIIDGTDVDEINTKAEMLRDDEDAPIFADETIFIEVLNLRTLEQIIRDIRN